jgi:hypothetical protein
MTFKCGCTKSGISTAPEKRTWPNDAIIEPQASVAPSSNLPLRDDIGNNQASMMRLLMARRNARSRSEGRKKILGGRRCFRVSMIDSRFR